MIFRGSDSNVRPPDGSNPDPVVGSVFDTDNTIHLWNQENPGDPDGGVQYFGKHSFVFVFAGYGFAGSDTIASVHSAAPPACP